jgi:hypothetical protein
MARVIPFPAHAALGPASVSMPSAPTKAPCIVCGSALEWDLHCGCSRCAAPMHEVCFYGRVASLDEWREFLRYVMEEDLETVTADGWPDRLCPTCRA